MPPQDMVRANFNFALGNDEISVFTLHLQVQHGAGNTLNWPEATQRCADKLYAKWASNMGANAKPFFPSSVVLRDVTTYHLDAATGHSLDRGQATPATKWAGTQPSALPNEVSLAVTLQAFDAGAFVANRARFRGRFYLPPMALTAVAGVDATNRAGRTHPSVAPDLGGSLKNFLNDVQHMGVPENDTALGGADWWQLGIYSRRDNAFRSVRSFRLGDVFDVQRRRRAQQREVYTDYPISQD